MRVVRGLLAATGAALLGYGCWLVLFDTRSGTLPALPVWLAGSVAAHDAVLAPLVLLAGRALRGAPGRPVWRAGLLTAGALTLLALPLMLWQGSPRNPSVLPLDYRANWAWTLAGTAVVTVFAIGVRRLRASRSGHRRRNGRP